MSVNEREWKGEMEKERNDINICYYYYYYYRIISSSIIIQSQWMTMMRLGAGEKSSNEMNAEQKKKKINWSLYCDNVFNRITGITWCSVVVVMVGPPGGRIDANQSSMGGGNNFKVLLPLTKAQSSDATLHHSPGKCDGLFIPSESDDSFPFSSFTSTTLPHSFNQLSSGYSPANLFVCSRHNFLIDLSQIAVLSPNRVTVVNS